jgi:UDP-N-acetylglucosamine 2-epimerase (non-hydrolysing)
MSNIFFRQLAIPAASDNLDIGGSGHGAMTGMMLAKLESVYQKENPDLVIVYGDTNSTLAGALAAAKIGIPVAHIEAGMRSFVEDMPEEINRRLTDHMSRLLFCPNKLAVDNLKAEGIASGVVHCGDLMYELLQQSMPEVAANRKVLNGFNLEENDYVYLTLHRAANVDSRATLQELISIIKNQPQTVLFPVHPRTRSCLSRFGLLSKLAACDNVIVSEPLSYLDNLSAVRYARFVLTDSGGLQKEALFLGTPVLTLREETEWEDTLAMGNTLVGLDRERINKALSRQPKIGKMPWLIRGRKPSQIIGAEISRFFKEG